MSFRRQARLSLYARFLLIFVGLGGAGVAVALHQTDRLFEDLAYKEATRDAANLGRQLGLALSRADLSGGLSTKLSSVQDVLAQFPLNDETIAVKLWSPDGSLLYTSRPQKVQPSKHKMSPSLRRALEGKVTSHKARETPSGIRRASSQIIEVYYPIREASGDVVAVTEIYHNPRHLNLMVATIHGRVLILFLVIVLGSGLLIWLSLRQTFVRPLRRLVKRMEDLAAGHPSCDLRKYSPELTQVSRAFEEMSERLFMESRLAQDATDGWETEASARNTELESIGALAQAIFSSHDPKQITCRATRIITDALGGQMGSVMVLDEGREFVRYRCTLQGREGASDANCERDPLEDHSQRMIRCLRQHQTLDTKDAFVTVDCAACRDTARKAGLEAMLCVPLVIKGRPLGVLTQYFERPRSWSATELRFASLLANAVAISLEASELLESSRQLAANYARQAHQLAMVNEISKVANSGLKMPAAMEELTRHMRHLLRFDEMCLVLNRKRRGKKSYIQLPETGNRCPELSLAAGSRGPDQQLTQPFFVDDFAGDPRFERCTLREAGCRSAVFVPVFSRGKPVGVLGVARKSGKPFGPEDARLVGPVAEQIGIALENARLYEEVKALAESLERKVERRTRELALANQRRAQFLNMISHDLRTPLNAVIGFSELLGDPAFGNLSDRQEGFLKHISGGGVHLLKLVNDILDLARVDAGRLTLSPETFRVADALARETGLVDAMAKAKDIEIELTTDPGLDTITADPVRFTQIFHNLVSNAVKYSPPGSKVQVHAVQVDSRVEVAVADNGPGIDPKDFPKLFSEFERIERPEHSGEQGSGLGLPLTKRLVELQGGKIRVESALGKGSTFTVSFPVGGIDSAQEGGRKRERTIAA